MNAQVALENQIEEAEKLIVQLQAKLNAKKAIAKQCPDWGDVGDVTTWVSGLRTGLGLR